MSDEMDSIGMMRIQDQRQSTLDEEGTVGDEAGESSPESWAVKGCYVSW